MADFGAVEGWLLTRFITLRRIGHLDGQGVAKSFHVRERLAIALRPSNDLWASLQPQRVCSAAMARGSSAPGPVHVGASVPTPGMPVGVAASPGRSQNRSSTNDGGA